MIENIRGLVDVVPRLNIFGDDRLARLCEQVKEKIAERRAGCFARRGLSTPPPAPA